MTEDFDPVDAATRLFEALAQLVDEFTEKWSETKFVSYGTYGPVIDADDIRANFDIIRQRYKDYDWSTVDVERAAVFLPDLKVKTDEARTRLLPYLQSDPQVIASLQGLMITLDVQLQSFLDPKVVSQIWTLPGALKKDIDTARRRLDKASWGLDDVDRKLERIASAYDVAANLDATREDLEQALDDAKTAKENALKCEGAAAEAVGGASDSKARMDELMQEAELMMKKVGAAYAATTSEGLAKSFDSKARSLGNSVYLWGGVLVVALVSAVVIGFVRFPTILDAATKVTNGGWPFLVAQVALATLSLAAPVWLAWVATKQTGQRFRLSEDYAYKAALAAAYEGYRAEAARLDEVLEAQLFSIAMSRLDEIPLRLVEDQVSGSPFHELLTSKELHLAVRSVPGFRERLVAIFRRQRTESELGKAVIAEALAENATGG
ncbi:hypothetical protein [Stenotrophomonas geniculata]|jgi:hypothetical protein|uniref:hypothetical protein n=1 Tax=Stenotrophomonas geniculata TaxID=86188 RepID=UPI00066DB988|nr:hypothetical protein [Stenotrophomonas geniculata]MBH1485398.1 hypothetical protein [Stenotrophomonas maltophilia]MBN5138215.1 hypothetical protein [Stenotrophomonas maltophilia]MDH7548219.1 hypothetical protein [Stenotrophomonas geniculata]